MSDHNDIMRRTRDLNRAQIRNQVGTPTPRETGLPCPSVGDKLRRDHDALNYTVASVKVLSHNNHDDDGKVIGKIDIEHLVFTSDKTPSYTVEDDFDDGFWSERWQKNKLPRNRLAI